MATTAADICNLALLRIGQTQLITDLDENTAPARACNAIYETTRNAVLSRVPWKFAEAQATLAELDEEFTGWTYVYALPADCLKPRYLYPGTRNPGAGMRVPYSLKYSSTQEAKVLVTDKEDAELVYTVRPGDDNIALFPDSFVDALAWKLAIDLNLGMAKKPQLTRALLEGYAAALGAAAADDLNQEQLDVAPDSELITVR